MNNMAKRSILLFFCMVLIISILSSGCASTGAGYKVVQPLKAGIDLKSYANLELKAKSNKDVPITTYDMDRIVNLVVRKVKEKAPTRFKEINPATTKPSTLRYTLIFTRYDKGSAFARFMLIGLGQIHIWADVLVEETTKDEILAKYRVKKTFALGGAYGGMTRIEDCEEGFAKGVAALILKE